MEIKLLPRINKTRKKQRFAPVNPISIEHTEAQRFLYAGKNQASFELLMNSFETGFAASDLNRAASILKKLIANKSLLPEVIIIEGSFQPEEIIGFHKNFSQFFNDALWLIDSSTVNQKVIEYLKVLSFVDDIVNLKLASTRTLQSKVRFCRKLKHAEAGTVETSAREVIPPLPLWKRITDILLASVLLIVLSPLFLTIAMLLKMEGKGPVFYISQRAGRGYKIFRFYKFRTMEHGADGKIRDLMHLNQYKTGKGPLFLKLQNDPRVTRLGAFLRKTSLDELPQLLNVLKGDMSIVGNRPLPLYEAQTLTTSSWAERFTAPAGITGLWQVSKKAKFNMTSEERIGLDIDYSRNFGLVTDLKIMVNTPKSIIQPTNS